MQHLGVRMITALRDGANDRLPDRRGWYNTAPLLEEYVVVTNGRYAVGLFGQGY